MATSFPPESLDFLALDPVPVSGHPAGTADDSANRLPQAVIDELMRLRGVDGVWVERDSSGQRVVVLHYTPRGAASHLPRSVKGMPTRVVGGEPIRAL